jgi:hypothetical protein
MHFSGRKKAAPMSLALALLLATEFLAYDRSEFRSISW